MKGIESQQIGVKASSLEGHDWILNRAVVAVPYSHGVLHDDIKRRVPHHPILQCRHSHVEIRVWLDIYMCLSLMWDLSLAMCTPHEVDCTLVQ